MTRTGFSDTVRRTILVDLQSAQVWNILSHITNLWWAVGVQKTLPLAGPLRGFGSSRVISFKSGQMVRETIIGWKPKEYLSYVATSGLAIQAYHATISIKPVKKKTRVTWESVFADKDERAVENFKKEIGVFYSDSLRQLRNKF
ncbi:MAG: SRPBCC domain containing protein [Cenarchaeum symbiont of Oopsacas minuta]|nr:SRPBCC domain containing protein [Cenarchaeum symbiont of Oopsacas minuta]